MVSGARNNGGGPQARRTSAAAIGTDRSGRVLMIHCRKPLPTHDLIEPVSYTHLTLPTSDLV